MKGIINPVSGGTGPHGRMPMVLGGAALSESAGAVVVLHGRGGRASDLMDVAGQVAGPDFALFGPEAFHGTWYPHRFTEPTQANEPFLSSAVSVVDDLIERLIECSVPAHRIVLLGFSQGACLALECAGRSALALGTVVAFSGGLIGEMLDVTRYHQHDGMGVFLSCAEQDTHIPIERVRQSASMLCRLGAVVVTRLHRGGEHAIGQNDISDAAQMIAVQNSASLRTT